MLAAYLQYWKINLLTMAEYRADFFMWFGFTVVYHGSALAALAVTMLRFPSMNGWSLREMFFLYALWMTAHELHNALFFNVVSVPEYIREGRFDRFFVRPFDTLFQVLTVPSRTFPDGLILGIVTLSIATNVAGIHDTALTILTIAAVICGGAGIDLGISLFVAALSFWLIRVDTLRWIVMSLEQDFTRYPISIYTRGVRIVLAYVLPFAFMNYFPASYFLGKHDTAFGLSPEVGLLTPLIGLLWTALSYAFWNVGLRHYQGTGS
uniref:ABC transporter permease n=1 Tax=mine drainage metagenome TaxID=410659 RepID=E6PI10_9ZZZZ